ncbi:MAG: hypothetical protein IPM43_09115 [Actinomycetota bacterium]|nr:MAG: hypothetical protein IPM43_09115 [Actinomycetota bacterium]
MGDLAHDAVRLNLRVSGHGDTTVVGLHPTHTVADLAHALGWPTAELSIDGDVAPASAALSRCGLREGSVVERSSAARESEVGAALVLEVEAGPDAGHRIPLLPGRHVVGRSPTADVKLADSELEPHHLLVEVTAEPRGAAVLQLAGRGRAGNDDAGTTDAVFLTPGRRRSVAAGDSLSVGGSLLVFRAAGSGSGCPAQVEPRCPDEAGPWRRTVHRGGVEQPNVPAPVEVPAEEAAPTGAPPAVLGPALTGLVAAGVIAAVTGQRLILLIGAVGALVAAAAWGAHHVGRWRAERRRRRSWQHALERFESALAAQQQLRAGARRKRLPALPAVVARAESGQVWSWRAENDDAWWVSIGPGRIEAEPELAGEPADTAVWAIAQRHGHLGDVPVELDLAPGTVTGIAGPNARALARSMLVQLATAVGPSDWRLIVESRDTRSWAWTRWLPQLGAVEPEGSSPDGMVVALVDDPALVSARTAPLRRLLVSGRPAAVVVLATTVQELPAWCTCTVELTRDGRAKRRGHGRPPAVARLAGLSAALAEHAAAALAQWRDPELDDPHRQIPEVVSAAAILGADLPEAILARWSLGGADPSPSAPLGIAADGVVEVDLVRDGPHALVAGTTGSGKSELLRTLVLGLALSAPPDFCSLVLVDYKGGAAFDACARLPHVVGVVTDLDDRLAERVLRSLEAELRRREAVLRRHGVHDLSGLRSLPDAEPLARLVVVVDEFATLAAELPGFLGALVSVAQRGRSLGVHLVLATQRPGGVVSDDVRANTNLRIALRVQDASDSTEVIGDAVAATLPRAFPGRAVLRLGAGELIVFQAACTAVGRAPGGAMPRVEGRRPVPEGDGGSLGSMVRAVEEAALAWPGGSATAPWLPALPRKITPTDLADLLADLHVDLHDGDARDEVVVGCADDPDRQRRVAVSWSATGHLLVAGAHGSGVTSTLVGIARALAARHTPDEIHLYAIDGRADLRLRELADLDHVGAVVGVAEAERLARLVELLHARSTSGDSAVRTVVLVDGLDVVRRALDDGRSGEWLDRFDQVLAQGPARGVVAVIAVEHVAAVPAAIMSMCPQRWVMKVSDPADATLCGVPAGRVPAPGAAPGRAVLWPELIEAQLATPDGWPPPRRRAGRRTAGAPRCLPAAIGLLPADVGADVVAGQSRWSDTGAVLAVGLGAASRAVVCVDVPLGEHLLVVGPSRSGRTSVLTRFAESWVDAMGAAPAASTGAGAEVLWCSGRRRERAAVTLGELGRLSVIDRRTLVVVDDADMFDDPDGRLVRAMSAHPGLTVVAAGRPGPLRAAYGHWTQVVRRSRHGLLLDGVDALDADLLGAVIPRGRREPAAPGRGWLVVDGDAKEVVQISRPSKPPGPILGQHLGG